MTTHPEVIKDPRTTSKELQDSLPSIKVGVHDSTIRKRLGKNRIRGRASRQKSLLTKKTQRLVSHLPKKILIIPKTFGQIFCGLMRHKLNFLEGVCPVTFGVKPAFHKNSILPTVKHGGSVMSGAASQLQDAVPFLGIGELGGRLRRYNKAKLKGQFKIFDARFIQKVYVFAPMHC